MADDRPVWYLGTLGWPIRSNDISTLREHDKLLIISPCIKFLSKIKYSYIFVYPFIDVSFVYGYQIKLRLKTYAVNY